MREASQVPSGSRKPQPTSPQALVPAVPAVFSSAARPGTHRVALLEVVASVATGWSSCHHRVIT